MKQNPTTKPSNSASGRTSDSASGLTAKRSIDEIIVHCTATKAGQSFDVDDCLSYFDVCTAVPEMVTSGHLKELEDQTYVITDKGRADGSLTEDSIAYTVKCKADNAVARFNRQIRRSSFVKTQVIPREGGDYSVIMALDDEVGNLMTLELVAPNQRQAVRLSKLFEKKAENIYNLTMTELLDDEEKADEGE